MNFTIEQGEGPLIAPLPFSRGEYEARMMRLRCAMRQQDLTVFVSFSPENIFWITGHDSPAYHYVQACVVTLDETPVNLIRRIDATNTLLRSWSRRVVCYGDSDEPMTMLADLAEELAGSNPRIGAEIDSFFVSSRRFDMLRDRLGARLVPAQLVEPLRLVKSVEEIDCIRRAARLTGTAMEVAVSMAADGVDENRIAGAVWNSLVSNGSEFPGLPPFIVGGPRTSLGHSTWGGHVLRKGDPVVFEIPGVVKRYVAPLFRSGAVGEPPPAMRRLEAAVVDSLELLISEIKPGRAAADVHRKSVENFARHGYAVAHRSGYSVGVNYAPDWGEGHLFSIVDGETRAFEPGMVFHLVPGIYVPPDFVVVISETVIVTEDGVDVVTQFPRRLFTC
ncbi:Xaa-Pro peptidase family protein [Aestuariivirga sp.]|uniref:M24 family metallopeptidase n=1 Tax=Aestuariivirga sp. TaxID=2650926 RepID=UPI003017E954